MRNSTKTKKELQTKIELRVNDLIAAINSTIKTINDNLDGKELLFIIDDLRKANHRSVSEIFIKCYTQLSAINTKVIFSIPISLELSWALKEITDNENVNFVLNTINVVNSDGSQNVKNVQFLKRLIYTRTEETLFDDAALEFLIIKSGGILTYLFSMLVDASFNAMSEHPDTEKILMSDATEACTKMRGKYVKSIVSERKIPRPMDFF